MPHHQEQKEIPNAKKAELECIQALQKLDDEQFAQRNNHPTDEEMPGIHKTAMLTKIEVETQKLKSTAGATYENFIDVFSCVQKLKTLNVHAHPKWDSFWGKHHTDSLKLGLGYVRHAAIELINPVLKSLYNPAYVFHDALKEKVHKLLELDLFKLPRSNWPVRTPSSEITAWIDRIDHDEYMDRIRNMPEPPLGM